MLRVNKDRSCIWLCKCDCGKTSEVRASQIISKSTKSCGCLNKVVPGNQLRRKYSNPKESVYRAVFSSYKKRAKKNKLPFNLDFSSFKNLILGDCFYCNSLPEKMVKRSGGEANINGIDRVDNSKGYSYDNCVTSCFECNELKSNHNKKELEEKVKKLKLIIGKLEINELEKASKKNNSKGGAF